MMSRLHLFSYQQGFNKFSILITLQNRFLRDRKHDGVLATCFIRQVFLGFRQVFRWPMPPVLAT